MRRLTVFCSSRVPSNDKFFVAAKELANELVNRSWRLVYGGAKEGLMGFLADAVIERGGEVEGHLPLSVSGLTEETAHPNLTELVYAENYSSRKMKMIERGDAFMVMPGGFGTLDEVMEVVTLKMMGLFDKPILFINVDSFWNNLLQVFQDLRAQGLASPDCLHLFEVYSTIQDAFKHLDGVFNAWACTPTGKR